MYSLGICLEELRKVTIVAGWMGSGLRSQYIRLSSSK